MDWPVPRVANGNAWTGTILQGTHRRPSQIFLILRSVATGQHTAQMARELSCNRKYLLELRHRLEEHAWRWLDRTPLGDGVREVHCNSQEGIWTHVRNLLRRFLGVSKWYLAQYEAVFAWGFRIKAITDAFLRILLGIPPSTDSAS